MYELVTRELTNEEILDNRLRAKLKYWGVSDDFKVEDEAKGFVLAALSEEDIMSVYIDNENGLCIGYTGDSPETDQNFIPNVSV